MTKDEIKKALECCSNQNAGSCNDCSYNDAEFSCAHDEMCKDALNLITGQDREIEFYKDRLKHLSPCDYKEEVANLGTTCKYEQEIRKLKEDFESLQKDYEFVRDCDTKHCLEINETVKQAKIDVLNEVKKRIYDISPYNPLVTKDDVKRFIDKLINEVENGKDIS